MGNSQKKADLLDVSMELKMQARQLEKQSQKVEQLEKAERKKIIDVCSLKSNSNTLGIEQRQYGQCKDICRERNQE